MCGSHRSYFKVDGRFIDIGFDEHNGEMAMRFAAKQSVHAIAIVPSVTNRDPRVVDQEDGGEEAGPQERTFAWPHNPLGVLFEDPRWGCGPAESYAPCSRKSRNESQHSLHPR